jgi:membrane protein
MEKKPGIKGFFILLRDTFKEWYAEDPFRQSAVIAYYAIFSLPALLVLIVSIASAFFGTEAVMGNLSEQVGSSMGDATAEEIENMVANATLKGNSLLATIIGIAVLAFGATGVFAQLQKSLNTIWEVEATPKKQFLKILKDRLFSFGLILSIGFLMLISFVVSSLLASMNDWMEQRLPESSLVLLKVFAVIVSVSISAVLFALMFKVLPDAWVKWRYVRTGAILTALLFEAGKFALGIYFGQADPASAYGAAGSIILILLWVSYSCMLLFFGAEFTKQYATHYGEGIVPARDAIHVPDRDEITGTKKASKH